MIRDIDFYKIVDAIKNRRKEKKISQNEMARELGISQVSYNNLENGRTPLTVERFFMICKILDLNPFYILRTILPDYELKIEREWIEVLEGFTGPLKQSENLLKFHINNLSEKVERFKNQLTEDEFKKIKIEDELNAVHDMFELFEDQLGRINDLFSEGMKESYITSFTSVANYPRKDIRYSWPGDNEQ